MKIAAAILVALSLSATALPQAASSRWQRVLTPSPAHPTAEQCVRVDAELYAHAAPGLRDVRLMQDGAELPYAMDVSFDTRVGEAAPPPSDDRAMYDVVQVIPLVPQPATGVAGVGMVDPVPGVFFDEALLSAHVPVERFRLEPAPRTSARVELRAAARMAFHDAEAMTATLTAQAPAAPFTIGANLQEEADILVRVYEADATPKSLVLEMRRREICYRPRSASPVYLFSGDGEAQPARYDYAARFQPTAEPVLATMGPVVANPSFSTATPQRRIQFPQHAGLLAAGVIVFGSLLVTAFAVWELRRR